VPPDSVVHREGYRAFGSCAGARAVCPPAMSSIKDAQDKYLNFGDNTMKDRLAAHAATQMVARGGKRSASSGGVQGKNVSLEPSGRCGGWDKYYFFSVPAGGTVVGPTARLGRSRPAAGGPQTFCSAAFSPEEVARQRPRIEKRGARTSYTEFYSQFPRASTSKMGLPQYEGQRFAKTASHGVLARCASDTLVPVPDRSDAQERERLGPHWPPKTEQRPDYQQTNQKLFPGGHRTFVDLYSGDRPAARGVGYSIFIG